MKIVTTTSVFRPSEYPCEQALLRLARIGFRYLDLDMGTLLDPSCPFVTDDWEAWAHSLRRLAEENGVQYTHAHACGDVIFPHPLNERFFAVCRILEIPYCVVHPFHKDANLIRLETEERFVEVNAEGARRLLKSAEKNNVIILSENILSSFTRYPTLISAVVQEVNSPWFGWCYDTGHANAYSIPLSDLCLCEAVPLSLHIHDNLGDGKDDHMLPGDGTTDWKLFLDTLHKIGYKGEMVTEAHHPPLIAPDDERDGILTDLLHRAEKMREYYLSLK